MSKVLAYFDKVLLGMVSYFRTDKAIVLLIAVLLVFWLKDKKRVDEKGNRFLVYTFIMTVLLLCPITAVAVMIYQTNFYDYEWAWSLVPMVGVIAYAGVLLYEEWADTLDKWKKAVVLGLMLFVLFLCGNQATLQTVDAEEANSRNYTEELLECIEQNSPVQEVILWAPKNIMQEVRRQTGEILLIYGKDMWDAKSGAYDYEVYPEGFIQAYEWMEWQEQFAGIVTQQETFAVLCQEYKLDATAEMNLQTMILAGANTIVMPKMADEHFAETIEKMVEHNSMTAEKIYTEQYAVYLLQ